MKITIIVAMSENKVIGIDNQIPWKLSADMQFFKQQTTNQTIVMGRKTFESLKKPLPNRNNWILTTQKNFVIDNIDNHSTQIFFDIKSVLETAKQENIQNLWIIGGKQIYEEFLEMATYLFITKVKANVKGDTFFPEFDEKLFTKKIIQTQQKDEKNQFDFEIIGYEK